MFDVEEKRVRNTKMELMCKLTPSEHLDRARDLSGLITRHQKLDDECKTISAKLRTEVKHCANEVQKLSQVVGSGEELRNIDCSEETDYANKVVVIYRNDTGERVHARAMSPIELQVELPVKP